MDDNRKVATGYINEIPKIKKVVEETEESVIEFELNADDIYKLLEERDYNYR